MSSRNFKLIRQLIPALFIVVCIVTVSAAEAAGGRDLLWDIVSNCLNPAAANYCNTCRWPRIDSSCPQNTDCKQTTEVWAESEAYVVLRDAKMCGCPKEFVHGLALPRARVTGVDDPQRPDGIWKFAWETANRRFSDTTGFALVVNPAGNRSQDQLHVHLVRMASDALLKIANRPTTTVISLDDVWKVAAKSAVAQGFKDYGVLVYPRREGGFTVLIDQENPEKKYTTYRCR